MAYELIICEKPSASNKIANALADGKPIKENIKGVPYYLVTHGKRDIVVACAVGHLYGLAEKNKKGWTFPVFDIEWVPSHKMSKSSAFSKKYLDAIKKLAKDADEFTVATDFDVEGEVIGYNVIRYVCKQKDANRMKFSTLTKADLIKSYENKNKHLDWGQANAGETRHFLDWMNGINYSRALTSSIKKAGSFKIMSTGRVQGPALKIIVDKEKEIKAFKPVPYWQIELQGKTHDKAIIAWHKEDKFWEKEKADEVMKKVKGEKVVKVDDVKKKKFNAAPPTPFDLTTLQTESYRCLRIAPKDTLAIAQELYTSGYISYPRTSSQQLDPKLGFKKILDKLSKQDKYNELAKKVLAFKVLKPNNGKKTDPAHPAIYPTGIIPGNISEKESKVYDIIVKRFFATFAEAAVRQTMTIDINSKEEIFIAKGTTTLEKNWHEFYAPYVKLEEEELPEVNKGDKVDVNKFILHDKETLPPKRYTPASIIKELEKRSLGTKCLTSNNQVKINSNNQIHNKNIKELFDDLYSKFPVQVNNGMKIAINQKKKCFCFDEFEEIKSNFKLVSKRKLKKDEKVYRIEYKDGSIVELTDKHPVLIFDGNFCIYKQVKNLKKDMKSVTSIKAPEKNGEIVCTWEEFLKKSIKKTRIYGFSNEMNKLRKKNKLSQFSFGKKIDASQTWIFKIEKTGTVPLYIFKRLKLTKPKYICSNNKNIKIKNPFPLKMTSSLARILANLVGDCSIDKEKIKRENCYDFRYHNTDINLINKFVTDIKNIFGIDLVIRVARPKPGHLTKYYIRIPSVIGRIFSVLFPEVIKKDSVKIPYEFYNDYIGSLFDDEGHCMKSEPKLFISNTNFDLLEDVKEMLSSLGIISSLDKKQYKLYVRGRNNIVKFLEKISFYSFEKKKRLIDNLSKFYKYGRKISTLQKQSLILSELNKAKNNELTNRELSTKLNLKMARTKDHLRLLINNGYIQKNVIGISEYPRKKISYKLIKPIEETFSKYIDETVISPDFITKTINSVKKIEYNGHVYDITNNSENPNFILSNGVVVHNSTRSEIVETLFKRGYVDGKSIQATELGIRTLETLEKYTPKIVDEELTRSFEEDMDKIREGKLKQDSVLKNAKNAITKIIEDFKKHELSIGKELLSANIETRDALSDIGKCPNCKDGELHIRKGKFGRFAACNKYPKCKTTFSLPANGIVKPSDKVCETCNFPKVLVIKKGKKPMDFCLNPQCKTKYVEGKAGEEAKAIAKGQIEKECPKCKEGKLVLRGSVYGKFYGCSLFPKCKHIEKLENNSGKGMKEKNNNK